MRHFFLSVGLAGLLFVPIFVSNENSNSPSNDGGVFICEDTGEKGPIFYPATYSSEISNEPYYSTQNGYTFSTMNYNNAHKYYRGDSVKVAVIDSGLNYTHEDFKDTNNNYIIQGNSRTIDNTSGSWLYYQFNSGYQSKIVDSLGHGTNVASVIASQINALGCSGIAPNVELYVYKVTNTSNGYEWTAINSALSYCVSEGIDVINMSFQAYEHDVTYGGSTMPASTGCSSVMTYYLNQAYNAGITLVAAAGNYNTSEPSYPASNNHVISVGSLAESSSASKASYSNTYGIDLVAPGTVYVADKGTNTAYKKTSGTSFSAPIVTAAIALYKQKYPSATPAQIESALYASCDSISGNPSWAGNGRLNIDKFLGVDVQDSPTEIIINNPEIVDEELELEIGDYLDLDWTVNGVGTFDDSVNFYTLSGEDNVVSVNSNGRITATGVGSDYVVIESNADSGVYASVYITVTSSGSVKTLSSIAIETPPSQTTYIEGNTFNPSGLVIRRNYSDSTSDTYTYAGHTSEFGFTPSTSTALTTGNTSVTITYGGLSCSQNITVNAKQLSSISISGYKTEFNKNDDFSFGGTVTAHYNNGTSQTVTSGVTYSGYDMATPGVQEVTVSYGGKTATYNITVKNVSTVTDTLTRATTGVSGTSYSTWSNKKVNSDAVYAGQSAGPTSGTGANSIQLRTNNSNSGIITTASGGKCTKIEVVWHDDTTSGRTINIYGKNVAYTSPTELFSNSSSGTLIGTIVCGTSTQLVISDDYEYIGIRSDNGALYLSSVTFTWSNSSKTLTEISVKTAPNKLVYLAGEKFDPTGLELTATYDDETSATIKYSEHASDFSFTPNLNTNLTTSNTSVTITYQSLTATQAITVKQLTSISLSNYTTSFVEGDTFSFGGTVTAHYSGGSSEVVTSGITYSGYDMTTVGNQTVTVTYGGVSETYSITVSAGTLVSIAVSGQTTEYVKNAPFSFDGVCTATFANGYQKVVTPSSVSSPDMSSGGQKTVTVTFSYNGETKSTSYNISVNSYRTVMEASELEGQITWPSSSTASISGSVTGLNSSLSGKTAYESSSIRLGTGSGGGALSISSSIAITKVKVTAKYYSSSYSSSVLKVDGQSVTPLTSSYADYTVTLSSAKTSFTILTENSNSRINIQRVTVYAAGPETDIGESSDCVGLETFINTYLHMDYMESLGYCKDSEHHYYSTAKAAFNNLNEHQRKLFSSNSAYSVEWNRLSTWASFNGDTLNSSTLLASGKLTNISSNNDGSSSIVIIIVSGFISSVIFGYFLFKKRKEEK